MASAGMHVHDDGGKRVNKEEQEIADFLSSIDQITTGTEDYSFSGGNSPGANLFFGPTSPSTQNTAGSNKNALLLPPESDEAIPDWLKDLRALEMREDGSSAPAGQNNMQQQQQQQEQQQTQTRRHMQAQQADDKSQEILGMEPEILDAVFGDDGDQNIFSGALTSDSIPAAGSAASVLDNHHAAGSAAVSAGRASDGGVAASSKQAMPGGTEAALPTEGPIDWRGTLDMLGMEQPEAGKNPAVVVAATNVGVPVSVLPTMPLPASREETFPDFVEIKDSRYVSQFPKPDSALSVHARKAGDNDDGGDSYVGDDGGPSGVKSRAATRGKKHVLPAPLRTVEVYIRPDVTWESVSDAYMAVMLSRGLIMREQTDKMVTAEKAADGSGDWATVKLRVGVTRDKLRTLVIQFYADARAPILSLARTVSRFSGGRAGDELYTAIRDALVEKRMPLSFLATDAEEISLDPHYVRDLVGMYAHENMVNLTRYALPLEEFVRKEEERSALLEATLLPQYRASELGPPRPIRSNPLSAYPLTTRRPPVSSCGVEEAREVMERAREHVRVGEDSLPQEGDGEDHHDGIMGKASVADGIRSLIRATWEEVKGWCDEEAEARVRRKDSQVRDRLLAVERHREALVAVLRDGAGGSAAVSTPGGREFAGRFRPMAQEAVLCQCKAMHAKRVGQLYLTFNHLCFHSSVLGFTSQKVLPLLTVASISCDSSALGMDYVTLTNRGGEAHSFGITAMEAGFPQRFQDLMQQCLVMCKAEASRRAAKEGAAKHEEPDEEQILARVQRLAKAKQLRAARETAAAANRSMAADATAADIPDGSPATDVLGPPLSPVAGRLVSPGYARKAGGGVGVEGAEEGSVVAGGVSGIEAKAVANKGGLEKGAVGQGDGGTGAAAPTGSGKGGSMMAMGIQAFLEESQK